MTQIPVIGLGSGAGFDLVAKRKVAAGENNGAANAANINALVNARGSLYPLTLKGGHYDVVETIGRGVTKTNWSLLGSGAGQEYKVAGESFWSSAGQQGGAAGVRLYWNSLNTAGSVADDRAMIRVDVPQVRLDGIDLHGTRRFGSSPIFQNLAGPDMPTIWAAQSYDPRVFVTHGGEVWRSGSSGATSGQEPGIDAVWIRSGYQARIGVWHMAQNAMVNGPLRIGSVALVDLDVGLLAGPHTNSTLSLTGVGHADTIQIENTQFQLCPVGIWIRTVQSVQNRWGQLIGRSAQAADFNVRFRGETPIGYNALIWTESGGNFVLDQATIYPYRTLWYDGFRPHNVECEITQWYMDGVTTHARLYKRDRSATSSGGAQTAIIGTGGVAVNLHNSIDANGAPVGSSDPNKVGVEPLVDAGDGKVILRGCRNISAGMIRMQGVSASRPAIVDFEGSSFNAGSVTHPRDLIHATSESPYVLSWRGCDTRASNGDLERLLDGFVATGSTIFLGTLRQIEWQNAPATANDTTELTPAKLFTGIITSTQTSGSNMDIPLPAGATLDAAEQDLDANRAFDWSLINKSEGANSVTLTATSGHTIDGNALVAAGTSGRFRTRKTADDTYVTYRI